MTMVMIMLMVKVDGDIDDDDDNLHFASWECRWSLRLTNDRRSEQKVSSNTEPKLISSFF